MNILGEADKVVNQRQKSYDQPEDNFQRIADFWTAYAKGKEWEHEFISSDVAAMMILLKVARQMWKHKPDNLIDLAGYAQCWERLEAHD